MRTKIIALMAVLVFSGMVVAQQVLTAATISENARIKPLVAARQKAFDAFSEKRNALPEYKALQEAQAKFEKVAEALPEYNNWKSSQAAVIRESYRIMAEHKLSHLDYEPRLNDKGDLEFVPVKPQ